MTDSIKIAADNLRTFASDLFQAAGLSSDDADIVSDSLVLSNLCGHNSHGVMRTVEYVNQMKQGELRGDAELNVLQETDSLIVADAGFGFGQIQMRKLIERLSLKAQQQGIACGTLKSCGHVGRLGEWVERLAEAGLAGFVTVNDNGVLKCVAPPGGVEPRISTNPIAVGIPTENEPLVLDISTSAVANGKIRVADLAGEQCPAGWLQDSQGNPTGDPKVRLQEPYGSILPFGGEQGYKAFGLGLLFDILVGGLSGGFCPPAADDAPSTNNVLLVVWDPKKFAGQNHFLAEAEKLIAYVRDTKLKPGVEKIRLPGDRSLNSKQRGEQQGVPLDSGTWQSLVALAEKLGVNSPEIL